MANQYIINAGLRLGVTSATVSPVVSSLKKQFASNPINVPVNIKVSSAATKNIKAINSSLESLSDRLTYAERSADVLLSTLRKLNSTLINLHKNIASANSSAQTFSRLSTNANKATKSVNSTSTALTKSTRSALTLGEAVGVATRRLTAFAPAALLVYGLGSRFVEATKAAIDFDSELVKLKQVGDDSARTIASIAGTVTKLSTTLGTSSGDLIKSAVTLRQAGLSASDTRKALEALGKTTLSASFDNLANTTEGVIAVLAQFKGGAAQLEKQLGSISKVSADYAVESSDLVEAIKRMGGAFSTTGGNLNELLAVFTAVRATTRESAESISTGIRTITARMQSPEAEAALRELGINIRDGNKQALSLYKTLDLISDKIKELPTTDKRFAVLANALGGNRNLSRIIPLLKETDLRHKAFDTAKQGEGILDKDAALAQEKLITQLNKLKESFLELFRIVSNDSSVRLFFSAITTAVSTFAAALKELKPLIPLFVTLAAVKGYQGARSFFPGANRGFKQLKGYSKGGIVTGGIPGKDSVPAMLEPGELVVPANKVKGFARGGLIPRNHYGLRDRMADLFRGPQGKEIYKHLRGSTYLTKGSDAIVFQHPEGHILRLGSSLDRSSSKYMLQASKTVKYGDHQIEELPFAPPISQTVPLDKWTPERLRQIRLAGKIPVHKQQRIVDAFKGRLEKEGISSWDVTAPNIARYNKRIVAIDPETIQTFSSGGLIGGLPSDIRSGTDSIPVLATPGEFMLSRDDVQNMGGTANVERLRRMARGVDQFSRLTAKYGYDAAYDVTKKQQNFDRERNSLLNSHTVTAGTLSGYQRSTSRLHKMSMKERLYKAVLESHGIDTDTVKTSNYGRKLRQLKIYNQFATLNIPRGGSLSGTATGIIPITNEHKFYNSGTAIKSKSSILGSLSSVFLKRQLGGTIFKKIFGKKKPVDYIQQMQDHIDEYYPNLNVKDYVNKIVHDKDLKKAGKFDPQTGNIHIPEKGPKNLSVLMHELGHAIDFKHGSNNKYATDDSFSDFIPPAEEYYTKYKNKSKSSIGLAGLHKYNLEDQNKESFANAFASHVMDPNHSSNDRMEDLVMKLPHMDKGNAKLSSITKQYVPKKSSSNMTGIPNVSQSTITNEPISLTDTPGSTLAGSNRTFIGHEGGSKIGSHRAPDVINPNVFSVSKRGVVTPPSGGISPPNSSGIPVAQRVSKGTQNYPPIGIDHGGNAIGNVYPLVDDTDTYRLAPQGEARRKRLSAQTKAPVYGPQNKDYDVVPDPTIFSKAKDHIKKGFSNLRSYFTSAVDGIKKVDSAFTKATGGTSTIGGRLKGGFGKLFRSGTGRAALGVGAALGAPLIADHFLGNAEKPGKLGIGGAQAGSALGGAVSGGVTGAFIGSQIAPGVGTAVGGVIGALTGLIGSLSTFNEELKQVDLKKFQESLSSIDFSKGKLSNIEHGSLSGLINTNTLPLKYKDEEKSDFQSASMYGASRTTPKVVYKERTKQELLDSMPEEVRQELSQKALQFAQGSVNKNPTKTLKDIGKDFGEHGAAKFTLTDLIRPEDKDALRKLITSANDLQAKLDALGKAASNSFALTIHDLETFNKALTTSGEKLQYRQQTTEVGSNALQGQISSGVNNVTIGALGGGFKHVDEFAKPGGEYDQVKTELTRIIQQVGQNPSLKEGPDVGSKAQSLLKGGGAYKDVIGDQLNEVLSHEKDLLKKTDTFGGAKAIAERVLEQSPANAVKQTYDQGTASLRQSVDIKHAADTQRRNRQIEIDQQRGSIDQVQAEKATNTTQTNAILNPFSRREYTRAGTNFGKNIGKNIGLYSSRTVSAEEASQRDVNSINQGAFAKSQQTITGIAGGGSAGQIVAQIGNQQQQLKAAQSDQEKYKGTDIKKYEEASTRVGELTEGLKRSSIGLNNLANSTIKVDGAQKLLAIATSKFQGDLQSRTNDADVALFGSKKEQRDLFQTEQLTQQVQQDPSLLGQLSDKQRAAVGARLKESGDQVRSFEQVDKYGRSRGVRNVSGNDTLESLRKQYLAPTRGSSALAKQVAIESRNVGIAQDERTSNIQANIGVQSTDAESQAKATTENFQQYLKDIQSVINQQLLAQGPFIQASKDLATALTEFPRVLEIKRDGNVNVILNGIAAIAALKGDLAKEVAASVIGQFEEKFKALEEKPAR